MQYLVSLLFLQSSILAEEERAGCFSLIVFLLSCGCVWYHGLVYSVSMASHLKAGVHFKKAVEHLHLTDMRFILYPLLISYMCLVLLTNASKQLLVDLYHLASQLFQLV